MGLAEKRAIEGFKGSQFKTFETEINNMIGKSIPFDVKWDEFAPALERYDDKANALNDYMEHLFLKPLKLALESITADEMGKGAIKEALNKIEMKNSGQHYGESGINFSAGTLQLDFMYANTSEYSDRAKYIQTTLEKAL